MDLEKIGKYIAKCRKEQGLTQEELALKLGITAKAVSKWECGKGLPDISIMLELCYILGINIISLLMGENSNTEYYIRRTGGSMSQKMQLKKKALPYPKITDLREATITSIKDIKNSDQLVTIEVTVKGFRIDEKYYVIRCNMEVSDKTGEIRVYLTDNQDINMKNLIKTLEVGQVFRITGSLGESGNTEERKLFFVKYIQKIEQK